MADVVITVCLFLQRETLNKELERERALRLDAEKRLRESRAENSSWQSKVKAQREDLSK